MFLISSLVTNILYIFIATILGLIIIALLITPIIYYFYEQKHFIKLVYRKIYGLAMYNDFYLINKFTLKAGDNEVAHIDHLLLSNKYIYVIKDRYYPNAISASRFDQEWYSYSKDGTKTPFINPLLLNSKRCDKFSDIKRIDRNYLISIVVVNDNAYIEQENELNSYNSFICYKKGLKKLIKKIEKRDVNNFKPEALGKEVMELWKDTGREY